MGGVARCICVRKCGPAKRRVCGTDGQLYGNRCELHKSGCLTGVDIEVDHTLKCFIPSGEWKCERPRRRKPFVNARFSDRRVLCTVVVHKLQMSRSASRHFRKTFGQFLLFFSVRATQFKTLVRRSYSTYYVRRHRVSTCLRCCRITTCYVKMSKCVFSTRVPLKVRRIRQRRITKSRRQKIRNESKRSSCEPRGNNCDRMRSKGVYRKR